MFTLLAHKLHEQDWNIPPTSELMDLLVEMNEMPFKELQVTFFFWKNRRGKEPPLENLLNKELSYEITVKGKQWKQGIRESLAEPKELERGRKRGEGKRLEASNST
jgi:hypothetical protein